MTTPEEKLVYWREYHRKRRLDPLQREKDSLAILSAAYSYLEKSID